MTIIGLLRALHTYTPQGTDELAFIEGDILYQIDQEIGGWATCMHAETDEKGQVPIEWCENVETIGKLTTLYDYTAQTEAELSFLANMELDLFIEKEDWHVARNMKGEYGLVPANYVEAMDWDSPFHAGPVESHSENITGLEEDTLPSQSTLPQLQTRPKSILLSRSSSFSFKQKGSKDVIDKKEDSAVELDGEAFYVVTPVDKSKKKNNRKGVLGVRGDHICYLNYADKTVIQEWSCADLTNISRKNKSIFLEFGASTYEFLGAKNEMDEVMRRAQNVRDKLKSTRPTIDSAPMSLPSHQITSPSIHPSGAEGSKSSTLTKILRRVSAKVDKPIGEIEAPPRPLTPVLRNVKSPTSPSDRDSFVYKAEPSVKAPKAAVTILYDFESFLEGSIGEIIDSSEANEGWLTIISGGTQGLIPVSYTEPLEPSQDTPRQINNSITPDATYPVASIKTTVKVNQNANENVHIDPVPELKARPIAMIPQPIPSVLPTKAVLQTSNLSPIKRELPVDKTVFNAKEFTEPVVMSRPPNADVAKGGKVTSQAVSTPQEKKESIEAAKPMRQVPPPPARPNISMGNLSDTGAVEKREMPSRPKQEHAPPPQRTIPSGVRTWTDKTGTFKVEAALIGVSQGKVQLHKINGTKIAVPLEKLSAEDVEFLKSSETPKATEPTANAFDWATFFTTCGIDSQSAAAYTAIFRKERLDADILNDISRDVLKNLGLTEGDILRVMKKLPKKAVEGERAPTAAISSSPDQNRAKSVAEQQAEQENIKKLDYLFAQKLNTQSERQLQEAKDAALAAELQAKEHAAHKSRERRPITKSQTAELETSMAKPATLLTSETSRGVSGPGSALGATQNDSSDPWGMASFGAPKANTTRIEPPQSAPSTLTQPTTSLFAKSTTTSAKIDSTNTHFLHNSSERNAPAANSTYGNFSLQPTQQQSSQVATFSNGTSASHQPLQPIKTSVLPPALIATPVSNAHRLENSQFGPSHSDSSAPIVTPSKTSWNTGTPSNLIPPGPSATKVVNPASGWSSNLFEEIAPMSQPIPQFTPSQLNSYGQPSTTQMNQQSLFGNSQSNGQAFFGPSAPMATFQPQANDPNRNSFTASPQLHGSQTGSNFNPAWNPTYSAAQNVQRSNSPQPLTNSFASQSTLQAQRNPPQLQQQYQQQQFFLQPQQQNLNQQQQQQQHQQQQQYSQQYNRQW